jgi:hypothetical protein
MGQVAGLGSGDWYLNEQGNKITVLSVADGWCMVREGDKKPFVVPEEFVLGTFDKAIKQTNGGIDTVSKNEDSISFIGEAQSTLVTDGYSDGYSEKYKGWIALFQDEKNYLQFLKWQQQPTEVERMKNYQRFKENFIAHADRLLRDRGASNKDVFECLEMAFDDLSPSMDSTPNTQEAKAFHCLNEEDNGKKHRCKTQCSTCPELYGENKNTKADEDVRDYEASDKATSIVPCDAPVDSK